MKAIIIGAGRGSRLRALTEEVPKPYAPIGGRRILDWLLESLQDAGLDQIIFVGGYQYDLVRADYPDLEFRHNPDWAQTNILASLMCAEDCMDDGFVCTYADILYRPEVVRRALEHEAEAVLCVDTHWRTRYAHRSQHPEDDAEKVTADGDRITRINRTIPSHEADGEYIGVARFSAQASDQLRRTYHDVRERLGDEPWKAGAPFPKAYLIHLYEEMLEAGHDFHMVTTDGQYMEVDTEEDFELANQRWPKLYG
ncbi:MAG: phosphocholine cytidylyltransferase family protein [Candidatus Latescibacteria bacterium]|mgnify:FL=1|jgi:choline kinase|nr:phosphocholine cytidylyltransferase family protein [Candidatus Latescibacterota bacterium]MEC8932221.1 phosphocholine cytidylyltransferase family protein [Candidatus Latescibacterota bacterium]MEE3041280.1 phosphocholine cytidylyltransferase family protein [Candidatus Latescibacterota bacterium]